MCKIISYIVYIVSDRWVIEPSGLVTTDSLTPFKDLYIFKKSCISKLLIKCFMCSDLHLKEKCFRNRGIWNVTSYLIWICIASFFFWCFLIVVITQSGRDGDQSKSGDRVCSERTNRQSRAESPSVPGFLVDLCHHHGGQCWTDFSHLEGPTSSHPYVFFPWQLSLCRCLYLLLCDS